MAESHARIEGGWNPGEVWPVPVECLLNGMPTDAQLMFGGGHMFPPHFRHRFQPPVHLSSAHLGPLPGSINVTIPLAQHSMVDAGQVDESGNPSVTVQDANGQDAHNIPQPIPLDNNDVMDDETDEATDDDEDDEVDDEVSLTMGHAHDQHASQIGIGHAMEADSLVQCQVVRNTLQQPMMPMDGSQMQQQCLQQKQPDVPRHDLSGHNQTMNSISMSMTDDFATQNASGDNDPNSGFSVHGKMYFEGRVVLHLKQWTDSQASDNNSVGIGGNGNGFSSCAEQQHQKGHLHGCAVCRLKSPASHENHRSQKEAHRHTVKGVLFTFEDCIIVELYPEPPPSNTSEAKLPPPPPATQPEPQQQKEHPMPISSYMSPAVPIDTQQEQAKKFLHHLDVDCLTDTVSMQNTATTEKHSVTVPQSQTEDHGWWDECEFNDELKRGEADDDQDANSTRTDSSCIADLKLHNQGTQGDDDGDCDFKIKPKCPHCSDSFMTSSQLESHVCRTHSVVLLEEVDLSSSPNSGHVSSTNDNDSVTTLHSSEDSQQSAIDDPPRADKIVPRKNVGNCKNPKLRHQCPVCEKAFHVKRLLKQHLEEAHSDGNPFRCNRCSHQFTEEKRLRKHSCSSKSLMNQEKLSVPFEKIFSKTLPRLTTEISDCMDVRSVDGKLSSDEDEEQREKAETKVLRRTGRNVRISLQDAPEESSSGQENHDVVAENSAEEEEEVKHTALTTDKKKVKNEKPFKCDVCGKRFTVERRLQNHKISHNAERSSQCEKCGKRFVRKDKLMRHMYVHSEEKLFSCDICQKRFSRRDKLSDHLKSHGGADEIHNCPMCQKQFLRPDILKQHVKLHTMGNKHQCSECLRFVTGKDRLEKHMARHKEAKALGQTLLCPLCTKYFIQKQSLKAHIKKFHPDANINLDAPDSELSQQDQLIGQQMSHPKVGLNSNSVPKLVHGINTKIKQFECSHCQKQFAKKQALKKHMRKHQIPQSKSPDDSFITSPSPEDDCLRMHLPASASPVDTILTSAVAGSASSPSPAHSILPTTHPPTPPINIISTSSPSNGLNNAPPAHIPLLQQNINSAQCSHLQHASHGNHPQHHHSHHHLLTHGGHPNQDTQIPSMAHPSGQLHANLSQHVSVPMQHHVSIATQQSMCGSSYVLAYPHYSYQ